MENQFKAHDRVIMTIILLAISVNQHYKWLDFYAIWMGGFYTLITIGLYLIYQLLAPWTMLLLQKAVFFFRKAKPHINHISKSEIKKFRLEIVQWEHGGIQIGFKVSEGLNLDELGSVLYTSLFTLEKKDPVLHRLLLYYTLETLSKKEEAIEVVKEYLANTSESG